MDYIKLHAYSETDQGKGVGKHTFHAAIDHEEHSDAEDHEQIKKSMSISLDNGLEKEEALEADLHEKPELEPSNPRASMTSAIEEQSEAEALSIMMVGKMEVYGSDEDDEEYVYVTDTESEGEEEEQADIYAGNKKEEAYDYDLPSEQYNSVIDVETIYSPQESDKSNNRPRIESIQPKSQSISKEKVDQAETSTCSTLPTIGDPYSSILLKKGLNTKRRVSFLSENRNELNIEDLSQPKPNSLDGESLADKVKRVVSSDSVVNESSSSIEQEEAAVELDNMLRELDATHRSRSGLYRQPDIRPTASASSPGILQDRRNSYFRQQSRRLSVADMDAGSVRYGKDLQQQRVQSPKGSDNASYPSSTTNSDQGDFYDPFYSLSSRTASTFNSNDQIKPTKSISASTPTAQMIHERMLKNSKMDSYHRRSSINIDTVSSGSSCSLSSVRSRDNKNGFIHDFYNIKSNVASLKDNKEQFIDFAVALYDYEAADEGEISFKQGDLLGIISKGDDGDDQGWWEASLLDKQNQKVVRTGLVPSNFIETAFRA
ncbi:hypothetical protein G6F43_010602 [Rhizopus delemar]|nr:hypothetical protein G6F43_010602 [Rhizopus delemar]